MSEERAGIDALIAEMHASADQMLPEYESPSTLRYFADKLDALGPALRRPQEEVIEQAHIALDLLDVPRATPGGGAVYTLRGRIEKLAARPTVRPEHHESSCPEFGYPTAYGDGLCRCSRPKEQS